jgi:hypothetical protein
MQKDTLNVGSDVVLEFPVFRHVQFVFLIAPQGETAGQWRQASECGRVSSCLHKYILLHSNGLNDKRS